MRSLAEAIIMNKENKEKGIHLIKSKDEEVFISYSDLCMKSLKTLYNLQEKGIKAGDKLIIQIKDDDNENFIYVFWACILGKIIPVPLSVTYNQNRKKVFNVFRELENAKVIINNNNLENLFKFAQENNLLKEFEYIKDNSIDSEEIKEEKGIAKEESIEPDDIAYIQFSSGTTGESKGIVLTHKNLLTNINDIISGFNGNKEDSILSWMPLTHDMGMIGCHMLPLVLKCNQFIVKTSVFVRNPILWMRKINEHRITITTSSNFGFRYLLDYLKNKDEFDWDLSCLKKIFNGAEPISVSLIREFLSEFEKYKLKRNSVFPVYGMAEASLAIAFPKYDKEFETIKVKLNSIGIGDKVVQLSSNLKSDDEYFEFVKEGYHLNNCNIKIVDDFNNELEEGRVGHILIKGNNVTKRYSNSDNTITDNGWLNTSDIGFIQEGQIVIIARNQDRILYNGITYYPHIIEQELQKVEGILEGGCVVCGIDGLNKDVPHIVIFILLKKEPEYFENMKEEILKTIREKTELVVNEIIPVKKIPKTTSGKIQRFKLSEDYKEGKYKDECIKIYKSGAYKEVAVSKEE